MSWQDIKLHVDHWQTLIAGLLAIVAALITAVGAWWVASSQSRVAKEKERLQKRALAIAIYPELMQLKEHQERAAETVFKPHDLLWGVPRRPGVALQEIRSVRIAIPPLMARFADQLFIMEDTGITLLQILSVAMQYDHLLDTLAARTENDPASFMPETLAEGVGGHLRVLGKGIAEVEETIKPIYGEANPDMDGAPRSHT